MTEFKLSGGIPVFRPDYETFHDFRSFVKSIENIGMEYGIVKVIPPSEWLSKLPQLDPATVAHTKVQKPIAQTPEGGRGVYVVNNHEKRRGYSIKEWMRLCEQPQYQPHLRGGKRGHIAARVSCTDVCNVDDSEFTDHNCAELEQSYWRGLSVASGGVQSAAVYGADVPGSLFPPDFQEWNVADLDSPLRNLNAKVPGVNSAYLYCGMWRATFAWHLEDMDLPSINYIHFGAPKQWYTVPQHAHKRFYNVLAGLFPEDSHKCAEFLRHKTFLVSPSVLEAHGVPVSRIVHRQHEFILTFPYGYHAGFNYGYNVAESVNFATEGWLNIGLKSNKCTCVDHSVDIDVRGLVEKISGKRPRLMVVLKLPKALPDPTPPQPSSLEEENEVKNETQVKEQTDVISKPTPTPARIPKVQKKLKYTWDPEILREPAPPALKQHTLSNARLLEFSRLTNLPLPPALLRPPL